MTRTNTIHVRTIYTILDMLKDVGGLLTLLQILGLGVMFVYNLIFGDPLRKTLVKGVMKR